MDEGVNSGRKSKTVEVPKFNGFPITNILTHALLRIVPFCKDIFPNEGVRD